MTSILHITPNLSNHIPTLLVSKDFDDLASNIPCHIRLLAHNPAYRLVAQRVVPWTPSYARLP